MLKRLLFGLCLFLLPLFYISSLEINKQQLTELKGILEAYTSLTSQLKVTLIDQQQILKKQELTIQKLKVSFQNLKITMNDLENSYLKYRKNQTIKDYILVSIVVGLTIILILK